MVPLRTTRVNASSSDTSQFTATGSLGMPPPWSGSGAKRVQITKPSAVGSPDATPRENGSAEKTGRLRTGSSARDAQAAAAASDRVLLKNPRRWRGWA